MIICHGLRFLITRPGSVWRGSSIPKAMAIYSEGRGSICPLIDFYRQNKVFIAPLNGRCILHYGNQTFCHVLKTSFLFDTSCCFMTN